jgi:hypothetical protein
MKRQISIILITIGHATLTWLLFLQSFRMGMSRFDSGVPIALGERVLNGAVAIMMWPFITPLLLWWPNRLNHLFSGLLGYIPLLLNSLIWALVIMWFWSKSKTQELRRACDWAMRGKKQ